jgi:hypothetical protein
LLGYARDDYLRLTIRKIIRPEEVDRLELLMDDLANGDQISDTWDVRHADGSWRSFEVAHTFTADGHWEWIGREAGSGHPVLGASAPDAPRVAELEERLREREIQLASQPIIEQAKGILVRDLRFTDDEAFGYLVKLSQDTNVKLRTLAGQVVDTLCRTGVSVGTARATCDALTELRTRLRAVDG